MGLQWKSSPRANYYFTIRTFFRHDFFIAYRQHAVASVPGSMWLERLNYCSGPALKELIQLVFIGTEIAILMKNKQTSMDECYNLICNIS